MSNRMDEIVDLLPTVERVARDVFYTHGLEQEEAYGLLALKVVERASEYLILFREGQTYLIERRLKAEAAMYARAERVALAAAKGQYFYDPEYVRLFLPFFFSFEDWPNGPVPEDMSEEWRTAEAVDTAIDIKGAWSRLRDWQAQVICERHLGRPDANGSVDWDWIAEAIGRKNGKSAREAYASATRQLTVEMNQSRFRRGVDHPGPGARKAISNAAANAKISNAL